MVVWWLFPHGSNRIVQSEFPLSRARLAVAVHQPAMPAHQSAAASLSLSDLDTVQIGRKRGFGRLPGYLISPTPEGAVDHSGR
jgi:hypothetical protein